MQYQFFCKNTKQMDQLTQRRIKGIFQVIDPGLIFSGEDGNDIKPDLVRHIFSEYV